MKRLLAIFTCICVLIPCLALADNDYSYIKNANQFYSMNINDDGNAFISSKHGLVDLKFDHKYALEEYPSYVYSDIIVIDYYGDADPVWRIWINYNAKNSLGITSVSITLPDIDSETKAMKGTYTPLQG